MGKKRLSRKEEEVQKALGTIEMDTYKVSVYIPVTGIMVYVTEAQGVSARDAALKVKAKIESMSDNKIVKLPMDSVQFGGKYYKRTLSRDTPICFRGEAFMSNPSGDKDWWHDDMSDEEYEGDEVI